MNIGEPRPRQAGPRLRDVADYAEVSVMTVSNVVRAASGVAPDTRERVLAAIDALGYRPNAVARNLRSGRSGIIALALPWIDAPYFSELAGLIIEEARRGGRTVLIDQTQTEIHEERRMLQGLESTLIDGVILFPSALTTEDVGPVPGQVPVVLLGDRAADAGLDAVVVDNVGAAREATEHLIELGCRQVAAVGVEGDPVTVTTEQRLAGYREAMEENGLPEQVVATGTMSRRQGARAMYDLLAWDNPPDGVFCFSDVLALGALHACHEAGVDVPGDLAVVGFDDIEDAQYARPTLSTIRPDKARIAQESVRLLEERMTEEPRDSEPVTIRAPHDLVIRASTTLG